jgi:hypothetical protein
MRDEAIRPQAEKRTLSTVTSMNDLGIVCLWVLIGLLLSVIVSVSDFGMHLATVMIVAE